jgi:hypothetical protein
MADLTGLNLKKLNPTNWEEYPPGGGVRKRPHPPGKYFAKAPSLKDIKFDTKDGHLRFVNKATIQDPVPDLDDTLFDYVTNKPYERGKRKGASRMGDFLLAVGSDAQPGADHQEWADAVEGAADGVFPFILDWDAYDSEEEKSVAETASDFPEDPNRPGERLPYVEVQRANGDIKRIAARQRIVFYVFEREQ